MHTPLQAASHVDTVVFDKTGTLTAGRPAVVEVRPLPAAAAAAQAGKGRHGGGSPADDPQQLLLLAAAVERGSTHPLAKAIAAAAAAGGGGDLAAEDGSFVQEPGSGVTATVAGRRVSVGTLEWVTRPPQQQQQAAPEARGEDGQPAAAAPLISLDEQERQAPAPTPGAAADLAAAEAAVATSRPGHILVYVGVDGQAAATIEIADELRPDAAATIQQLQVRRPGGCARRWPPRRVLPCPAEAEPTPEPTPEPTVR